MHTYTQYLEEVQVSLIKIRKKVLLLKSYVTDGGRNIIKEAKLRKKIS